MAYDVDKMAAYCREQIAAFAARHGDEHFYGFAIDANMLCLNSTEAYAETLADYQQRWETRTRRIDTPADVTETDRQHHGTNLRLAQMINGIDPSDADAAWRVMNAANAKERCHGCPYDEPDMQAELRANTGDWTYQGFADLDESVGFDMELYQDHYDAAADWDEDDDEAPTPDTPYARAMTALIARLQADNAFAPLQRTPDFTATWVDHDY